MLLEQIELYHQQRKNTVLLVSHSMEDIARISDRVLVMNDSRLAMMDTTRHVFARGGELISMGLQVPQVTRVFMRLKAMGVDADTGVYTMEQAKAHALRLLHCSR